MSFMQIQYIVRFVNKKQRLGGEYKSRGIQNKGNTNQGEYKSRGIQIKENTNRGEYKSRGIQIKGKLTLKESLMLVFQYLA